MDTQIQDHYTPTDLISQVEKALAARDIPTQNLDPKILAPVDQLHTGGLRATLALSKGLDLKPDTHVLDAGCGLGGTARILAQTHPCRITGLDLTPSLVAAASCFTDWCALSDQINFKTASITRMPFEDHNFDLVLCQHILMNIEEKKKALSEIHRVLKPGGQLILHELFQGKTRALQLPVPWADSPKISFLDSWGTMEDRLTQIGFCREHWVDATDQGIAFWAHINKAAAKAAKTPGQIPTPSANKAPVLGPHLVFGKNARHFKTTMAGNFASGALQLVESIFTKEGEI